MTKRFAVIDAQNVVINIVVLESDSGWTPPEGMRALESSEAGIGWTVSGDQFSPPIVEEPPTEALVPDLVTRRQGRLALLAAGKLEAVEGIVSAAGRQAQIEYEADTWERSNQFLQAVWAQLGGTEAGLDALFIDARGR